MQTLILSLLFFSISSYAVADEIVTLGNGKQAILKDNGTWSHIPPPENETTGTYKAIKLDNLKLDINSLNGQQIQTKALAVMYDFMLALKDDVMDENPLSVNINSLSQTEMEFLRTKCNNDCTLTVYGRIGDLMHDEKGIIADKIAW